MMDPGRHGDPECAVRRTGEWRGLRADGHASDGPLVVPARQRNGGFDGAVAFESDLEGMFPDG